MADIAFKDGTESRTLPSASPVRDGADFEEWNTSKDGSGDGYAPGDPISISADTVLYAMYSSTVSYDPNGGTGAVDPSSVMTGSSVPLKDNAFHSRGRTFLCWNTSPDGTGTDLYGGMPFTVPGHITLYAKWGPWTILNATVGTTFTYSVAGVIENPQQYAWVNEAVEAASGYGGIAGITFSMDEARFRGEYVQTITDISDAQISFSRSGDLEVTIEFTANNIPLVGSKTFVTGIEGVSMTSEGGLNMSGAVANAVEDLVVRETDVYSIYNDTYFGQIEAKSITVGGMVTLVVDKETMVAVEIEYNVPGKFRFEAVLSETSVAW